MNIRGLALTLIAGTMLCSGCVREHVDLNVVSPETREALPVVLKDVASVRRIEVIAYEKNGFIGGAMFDPRGGIGATVIGVLDRKTTPGPLALARKQLSEMVRQVLPPSAVRSSTAQIWLRLFPADRGHVYYCRFMTNTRYLEIYTREAWPPRTEDERKWRFSTPEKILPLPCKASDEFIRIIADSVGPREREALFR